MDFRIAMRCMSTWLLASALVLLEPSGQMALAARHQGGGAPVYVPTDVRAVVVNPSTGEELGAPISSSVASSWILKVTITLDRYVEVPGGAPATTSITLEGNSVAKFQYMGTSWASSTLSALPVTLTVPNQRSTIVRYLYVSPVVAATSGQFIAARHANVTSAIPKVTLTVYPSSQPPPLPSVQEAAYQPGGSSYFLPWHPR